MGMGDHNNIIINGEFSDMPSVSLPQSNFPVLPLLQGQTMNNLPTGFMTSNHVDLVQPNAWIPRNIRIELNKVTDPSLRSSQPICNTYNQDRFVVGTSNPLEFLESSTSKNHYSDTLNSAFATSVKRGYDEVLGAINNKWDSDKFLPRSDAAMEIPGMVGFHPFPAIGNINANCCTSSDNGKLTLDSSSGSSKFSNKLSSSLATFQPSVNYRTSIQDKCSEIGYSGVTRRQFGSETSCNRNGSPSPVQLSEFVYGSSYLRVIQEILAEIASCSFSSSSLSERGYAMMSSDGDGRCEVQNDLALDRREVEAKKKQLLVLLQMVDERYARCLDHIHTVVSAFHAVSELDPQIHARFASQTVSSLYENLREKISNQILTMEVYFHRGDTKEEDQERSFETSFVQKQWALQRVRRKDHQLWRPQRGLPERSVSVLRAWMFQNFLHPYPRDAEKHLLAVRSGLTRSQVSNWFINARVRLWKPMIDEMYSEMNRRKGHKKDEERDRSHLIID